MNGMNLDPSKVLAIIIMIGMILGPWILHEKTLSRMEYKMDALDYKVSNLEKQAEGNRAVLAERKKAFEDIMADLKREIINQKSQP